MRYSLLLLLAATACGPAAPRAPAPLSLRDPSCLADLDSTVALVSRDYAGLADAPASGMTWPGARTDSVRRVVGGGLGEQACTAAIRAWLEPFGDPHLTVYGRAAPRSAALDGPASPRPRPAGGSAPGGPARALSLHFPDDSTAVLRLPTFDLGHRDSIDGLVMEHRARLLATPYLLIDVRGNGGGWSGSYRSVLPLLYTGPIRVRGIDVWASEGNAAAMRESLGGEGIPAELTAQIRDVIPRMEASPGRFVPLQEDAEIRMEAVLDRPRAVAVLVDRGCASACEQFVLEARQTGKVTVLGRESTRGALDYLNVRTARLPSGTRMLRLPIARLRGLPEGAVNRGGIAPEVHVPPGERDPLAFAARWLREAEAAP